MNKTLSTLIIHFANDLKVSEIPKFRGAVIAALGENANQLYHNHVDSGFRYSYPLIQYKRIHQKAAIVCMKESVETIIGEFFN